IWGARIQDEYKGKVRVMAIMTGVQSAQVLGPTTQKQADRSRASIDGESGNELDDVGHGADVQGSSDDTASSWSDGGRDEVESHNGVDVIR
ncbi:MAG: cell division protein FtsZ, partial [Haloferacaceae archaeon]